MTTNGYESHARTVKAVKIEMALRMAGVSDSATAKALDAEGRRNAEQAAGVRSASEATWAVVYVLLDSWPVRREVTGE